MIWNKGEWREASDFSVAAQDRAVLHGLSAFETMLAIDGHVQYGERHLARLRATIAQLGLSDLGTFDLAEVVHELCEKNDCAKGRARLRLTVTAGEGGLSELRPGSQATAWMSAQAWSDIEPCELVILPWTRNERGALAGLKSGNYAENLLGLQWARQQGASEGLFFNTRDELCEACTANVFLQKDGVLATPSLKSGCLPGVMRAVILESAKEQGIAVQESVITREQLRDAEQIYLSSALRGVVTVRTFEKRALSCLPFPVAV